jgi:hypothetical protein
MSIVKELGSKEVNFSKYFINVLKERKEGRKRKVSFFGLPHGPRPGARCP